MTQNVKNDLTELVFILDRSGSMAGLAGDTVGGFNSMLAKQRREAGRALVTTVLFNTEIRAVHDRLPLNEVPDMTESDYVPGGCTALLDAVGRTVERVADIHKYIRPEDVPGKTMFVITTDGLENSSRQYSYEKVRSLIEARKREGWEFIFLGANIDAASEAARFGIAPDRAVRYKSDSAGTALNFDVISDAVSSVRCCANIAPDWKERVENDVKKRGK